MTVCLGSNCFNLLQMGNSCNGLEWLAPSLFLQMLRYLWSDQRCPSLGLLSIPVGAGIKPWVIFSSKNFFVFPLTLHELPVSTALLVKKFLAELPSARGTATSLVWTQFQVPFGASSFCTLGVHSFHSGCSASILCVCSMLRRGCFYFWIAVGGW